jgi:DNA-binding Lrp family transcriptional regulator
MSMRNVVNLDPFAAALKRQEEERAREATANAIESPAANQSPAAIKSPAATVTGQPLPQSPAANQSPAVTLAHPEQHTRYPNEFIDTILPTLTPNEQTVIIRLYRWTRGYQRSTCKTSVPKISKACNISDRTVNRVLSILEGRGYVKRLEVDYSNPNQADRGLTLEVLIPSAARANQSPTANQSPAVNQSAGDSKARIERNNRNEILERGVMSPPDYKSCPDCQGSGFWYPEGTEKGVAKCKHERMSEGK